MNGAGDEFLAGSAVTGDQHGGVEIGYAAHQLVNALHVGTGTDDAIAIAGLFDALLDAVQLLLEGRGFTSPDEHGLEVPNRWRAATVAKCARTNEFEGSGTQAVVGHQDGWDIGGDKTPGKFEASLERVLGGGEIGD